MLYVLTAVIIWGSMFVVTKAVVDRESVDPLLFVCVRFIVASLCFVPAMMKANRRTTTGIRVWSLRAVTPALLGALFLSAAFTTQTFGIKLTSVPNAAFLSSAYPLFAPFLAIGLLRTRVRGNEWLGACAAILGTIALAGFSVSLSGVASILLLAGSLFYACQITAVAGRDRSVPGAVFAGQQMTAVAVLTTLVWVIRDYLPENLADLLRGGSTYMSLSDGGFWAGVLYAGAIGSALAFLLQTLGQNRVTATQTAILFAMEPVFASLLSTVLLGSVPDKIAVIGGLLIVSGVLVSNLPSHVRTDQSA